MKEIKGNIIKIENKAYVWETDTWITICFSYTKEFKLKDEVLIKKYYKPRSTGKKSQNNHFQGHCRQIAEHTGNDFKSVKLGIMVRAFEDMNLESLMKKSKKGDKEYYYLKDESELDTFECSQLIEMCHIVAGEFGLILKEGWE